MANSRPLLFWIAIGWVALIAALSIWQAAAFTGWYRLLAEWQMAQFGKYETTLTALLPGIILAGPALTYLGKRDREARAADIAAGDPAASYIRTRRVCLSLGLVSLTVAVAAYLWSQQIPDASGTPTSVDVASSAEPPSGLVELVGKMDNARIITLEKETQGVITRDNYIPIVPDGAASGPVRYLYEYYQQGYTGRDEAPVILAYQPKGILVENGLPGEAVAAFAREGIALASPHYLLTRASGQRDNFYIAAALGAMFALAFLAVALGQTIQIGKLRRGNGA